ncbi:TonB-dependent receptor [Microbulbifer taiwanensis]|uniref:TonB-dependent receptor n=1 Tax=Microbulbifer taiwanensis TaxID=986746 RepID=UPI003623DF06
MQPSRRQQRRDQRNVPVRRVASIRKHYAQICDRQPRGETETVIDFDSVSTPSFDVPAIYDDEQFTQEFQLVWQGESSDLVSGIYYYDGTASGSYDAVLAPSTVAVSGSVDTESLSAYAHYNWQFADQWNLNLGGRYTRDEKEADVYNAVLLGLGSDFSHGKYYGDTAESTLFQVRTDYTNSNTWSEFTPRIGLDYQVNEDAMLYASYSSGFKSGGFDMRGVETANPLTREGYAPETVDTVELGWKLDALNNRLRLNGALFRADYTDMQLTTQRILDDGTTAGDVLNAGKSRIQGIELEASLAITDNLTANANLGWVDAEFIEFMSGGEDIADTRDMQNTPDTTAMMQLNWAIPAAGGEVVVVPSVSYRSDTQIFETPGILDQDAYTLVDLTATYYSANGDWQLGLVGKNLTDKEYRIAGYDFGTVFQTGFYGAPRTIALTGSYNF